MWAENTKLIRKIGDCLKSQLLGRKKQRKGKRRLEEAENIRKKKWSHVIQEESERKSK